jgi:hypothetical protein
VSNKINLDSADSYCLLKQNFKTNESFVFNITSLKYAFLNKIYNNFLINFLYNNENQTILSNYTQNYTYKLFGSFVINVNTLFGGNLLSSSNKFINVQRIKTYPFGSIQINKFELNCTLNNESVRLDCILRVNLSNYANSFQQITIDYGDGISNDSFMINPYCKFKF